MRANGILFLSSNRLYKSNSNGTVSVLQDPYNLGGPSFSRFGVGQTDFFSFVTDVNVTSQPRYITVQWTADAATAQKGACFKDLNMPETQLQVSTTALYQWNGTNNFVANDTISSGLVLTNSHFGWAWRANSGETFLIGQRSTNDWWIWKRDSDLPATPGGWGGAGPPDIPSRKPADVDADGDNLYIAVLVRGGTPGLYKLDTSLSFDPTLIFDPMTGTNIGVQCGRLDADVIWIAGEFGSGNTVEKSEDAGATFDVKDGGTFGDIKAFVVGPGDDDRVLVFDTSGDEIYETKNSGDSWELINAATGTNLVVLERFSLNPEEIIAGSDDAYVTDNISYSINSGEELHDLNLPVAQEVSSVVIR
jgi:hypothetical protein